MDESSTKKVNVRKGHDVLLALALFLSLRSCRLERPRSPPLHKIPKKSRQTGATCTRWAVIGNTMQVEVWKRQAWSLITARRQELAKNNNEPSSRYLDLNRELMTLCKTQEALDAAERELNVLLERKAKCEQMMQLSAVCLAYFRHGQILPLPLVLMARDLANIAVPTEFVPETRRAAAEPATTVASKKAAAAAKGGKKRTATAASVAAVAAVAAPPPPPPPQRPLASVLMEAERRRWDPAQSMPFENLAQLQARVRLQLFYLRYRAPKTVMEHTKLVEYDFRTAVIQRARAMHARREDMAGEWALLMDEMRERAAQREAATLRRLKEQDLDQYLAELRGRKDERIQTIVRQTHDCLEKIMGKLQAWNKSVFGSRSTVASDDSLSRSLSDLIFAQSRVVEVPKTLGGGEGSELKLKSYQVQGLRWLASLDHYNLNGILADEMGLGKTVQTIAFLLYLKERGLVRGQHLVIAPTAVVPGWLEQWKLWAPHVRVAEWSARIPISERAAHFRDVVKKAEVVVATYDFVRDHQQKKTREKWGKWPHLRKIRWHVIAVDEGHHINNNNSQVAKSLRQFVCIRKLLLTGTPLQNSLQELWALLNYLMPEVFENDKDFEEWFQSPFGEEKTEMTHEEKTLVILRLHKVLAPFMLRRVKADVASDLPDVIERTLACELSPVQQLMYGFVARHEVPPLPEVPNGSSVSSSSGLASLVAQQRVGGGGSNNTNALRKVCNHPFLVYSDGGSTTFPWERMVGFDGDSFVRASGKFVVLDVVLKKLQLGGHRVLIFTPWTQTLEMLSQMMRVRGYRYELLTGATKGEEREVMIANFTRDTSIFVFLVSTHAGGEGVNLQAADTVIIFESDWNPQKDKQAKARVHRLGQQRKVLCLSLVSVDEEFESQDQRKFERADAKRKMEEKVIGAGNFVEHTTDRDRAESVATMYREEEQEGPTFRKTDQLDRLIARDEKELELLRETHIEMPVLLQLGELPQWMRTPAPAIKRERDATTVGRVRGPVNYKEQKVNSDEESDSSDNSDREEAKQNLRITLKRPRPVVAEEPTAEMLDKQQRLQNDLFGDMLVSLPVGTSGFAPLAPEGEMYDLGNLEDLPLDWL
jgi:hypothetical protein